MHSWKKTIENIITDFKNTRHNFNHIAEMIIIAIANNMDMPYDFYIKHNMHAIEWKLITMINKNGNLIKKKIEIADIL